MGSSVPSCIDHLYNCTSTIATCSNSADFEFSSLWAVTQDYAAQCPGGPWLFGNGGTSINTGDVVAATTLALTNNICKQIAGSSYTKYPSGAIWSRLTMWKFPLWQLIISASRAPLGVVVEAFSVIHMVGDPIGTITHLIEKVHRCQSRAVFWQEALESDLVSLADCDPLWDRHRLWKSLAIIIDSFDEWGLETGTKAQDYLMAELKRLCSPGVSIMLRRKYVRTLLQTADALAADRSTKFLPVIIAQCFFVGSVGVALIHTVSGSSQSPPSAWINIEMYSIAFTAQYFWVIFAVFCSSVIGTSQTSAAIPRILGRLKRDLEREVDGQGITIDLPVNDLEDERRWYNGGIYTWQHARGRISKQDRKNSSLESKVRRMLVYKPTTLERIVLHTVLKAWHPIRMIIPFCVVFAAAGTGQLIGALVPPVGWSCRSEAMLWMFVIWLVNWMCSARIVGRSHRAQFWFTAAKDFAAAGATFGIIIVTQIGWYNRCDCYTRNGVVGLQLPSMPAVQQILQLRLSNVYPAIVSIGIAIQLVLFPAMLGWRYHAAVQVFLQRDDGSSNLDWWRRIWNKSEPFKKYSAVDLDTVMDDHKQKTIQSKIEEDDSGSESFVEDIRESSEKCSSCIGKHI